MKLRSVIAGLVQHEDLNFLLTNRIPRRWLTLFLGWFSKLEQPFIRDCSLAIWRLFSELDLSEARRTHFKSLHDCFTRELKDGVRPLDPDPATLVSPSDGIIGASGKLADGCLLQAKGFPYTLESLLGAPPEALAEYAGGSYVTLRLTSSMYHRFHAPYDCHVEQVTYISGDTWNVNPIALKRIEQLFCKNERAVIPTVLRDSGLMVTLVPVAAILVASIRLHFLPELLCAEYRGDAEIPCAASFGKGEEMGWFEHGSTIIVFAPKGFTLCASVREGSTIHMGRPLMRLP